MEVAFVPNVIRRCRLGSFLFLFARCFVTRGHCSEVAHVDDGRGKEREDEGGGVIKVESVTSPMFQLETFIPDLDSVDLRIHFRVLLSANK